MKVYINSWKRLLYNRIVKAEKVDSKPGESSRLRDDLGLPKTLGPRS